MFLLYSVQIMKIYSILHSFNTSIGPRLLKVKDK